VLENSADPNGVSIQWPAFTQINLPAELSWQGSFVSPVRNAASTGPQGGPTVFFDKETTDAFPLVVVGSWWGGNWKEFSAGTGETFDGRKAWAPGTSARIQQLPVGYTQGILLHASTAGVTGTIGEWGALVQASRPSKGTKIADVTLSKIGYQTDNGGKKPSPDSKY